VMALYATMDRLGIERGEQLDLLDYVMRIDGKIAEVVKR